MNADRSPLRHRLRTLLILLAGYNDDKGFAQMSKYVETIAEALIDVLNGAASSRDHRIVGYAANFDFWIDEIIHCVAVVDNFPKRQELFADAVRREVEKIREAEIYDIQRLGVYDTQRGGVRANPTHLHYGESPTSDQRASYLDKTGRLRARLIEAVRKFVGRMRNEDAISIERLEAVKAQLPFL